MSFGSQKALNAQLYAAALDGDFDLFQQLAGQGAFINYANPSQNKSTPLMVACHNGDVRLVEFLILNKVNINQRNKQRWTALIVAAYNGFEVICQILLKNGAHCNVKDETGATALISAADQGHTKVCLELLRKGAKIDIQDSLGETALMKAAKNKHLFLYEQLCKKANLQIKNNDGLTAHDLVKIDNPNRPNTTGAIMISSQNGSSDESCSSNNNSDNSSDSSSDNSSDSSSNSSDSSDSGSNNSDSSDDDNSSESSYNSENNDRKRRQPLKSALDTAKTNYKNLRKKILCNKASGKYIQSSYNNQAERDFESIKSSLEILQASRSKKIATKRLFDEMSINIEKSECNIQSFFEECQVAMEQQEKLFQNVDKELTVHVQKMDQLFDEMFKCSNSVFESARLKENIRRSLRILKGNYKKSQSILEQSKKRKNEMFAINKENSDFLKKWDEKISEGEVEKWEDNELSCLLETIGLENWFEAIKNQVLTSVKLSEARPVHFMAAEKIIFDNNDENERSAKRVKRIHKIFDDDDNNNESGNEYDSTTEEEYQQSKQMRWGEAKYLHLVIDQIKQKKGIPKLMNDIDLNQKNIELWTVNNVSTYFRKLKLNEVANILSQARINGFVLFRLHEFEIEQLGIKNVNELKSFLEIMKTIQQSQQQQQQKMLSPVKNIETNIPDTLLCSLSRQIMVNPVIAQDGHTYEREKIEEWCKRNNTSPMTGEVIESIFFPNHSVRVLCEKWKREENKN